MAQQEAKEQVCVCPRCAQQDKNEKARQQVMIAKAQSMASKIAKDDGSIQIIVRSSKSLEQLRMKFMADVHTIYDVKQAYCCQIGEPGKPDKVVLIDHDKKRVLEPNSATLAALGITSKVAILLAVERLLGGGLIGVKYHKYSEKLHIGYDQYGGNGFEISAFHVSCKSDRYTGEDMTGIVLYQYDNKVDWRLNNIHCKSGYIVLKKSKNIQHIKGEPGEVHGACYKWMFNQSIDSKVIGGGFAYRYGQWKFNSGVFNKGGKYHDNKKEMHPMEQACIEAAIENWKKGIQNTYIKDIAKKYRGSCDKHGWY